jgi:hypothetical protein
MSQQLVKKGANGRMVNVNPKSWIEAIKDKNTGQTLVEILQGFNMYFLSYNGNTEETRKQVPMILRKEGLWITYVKYDHTVITEWYNSDKIDDNSWADSSNWREGSNTLVGDVTISSDGYWVIKGEKSSTKAQGEKGEKPLLRINTSTGYIQYSYDDKYWYDLIPISLLTPDIQVGTVNTLAAGSKAKVTKGGTNTKPILNFDIPMGNTGAKGEKGDGWQVDGWVDTVDSLPSTATIGTTYLVGTTTPYAKYVWKNNTSKWVEIGIVNEIKASIFDGGRADTLYGGAREINCGGADAYLTY